MKKSFLFYLLIIYALAFPSKKDEVAVNPDRIYQVSTLLNVPNNVPVVSTTETDTTTETQNQTTKTCRVTTTLNGIASTAGFIHLQTVPTLAGKSGSVTFLFTTLTLPVSFTPVPGTAQETDLLNGLMFVNFHTVTNPKGEIRGNLVIK